MRSEHCKPRLYVVKTEKPNPWDSPWGIVRANSRTGVPESFDRSLLVRLPAEKAWTGPGLLEQIPADVSRYRFPSYQRPLTAEEEENKRRLLLAQLQQLEAEAAETSIPSSEA